MKCLRGMLLGVFIILFAFGCFIISKITNYYLLDAPGLIFFIIGSVITLVYWFKWGCDNNSDT